MSGSGTGITRSETHNQVDDLVAQQGILLDRLLRPLSDRTLSSEQRRRSLVERDRTKLPRPATDQPRKTRKAKVGSNENWYDEMNRRIDRISRQLSFDSITSGTLTKYNYG